MNTDFFARLSGRTQQSNLEESLNNSLRWLLNSRKQFLPHLPDFGIRDLADIRNNNPREELKQEIKDTIKRFEPRVKDLDIEEVEVKEESLRQFYVIYRIRIVLQEYLGAAVTLLFGFDYEGKASKVERLG